VKELLKNICAKSAEDIFRPSHTPINAYTQISLVVMENNKSLLLPSRVGILSMYM
jgi:hypothetical protein